MECKYTKFTDEQFAEFKDHLHDKVHWLLIYKEEHYKNLPKYFESLMSYIGSFNELLGYDALVIDLLITLQVALDELNKKNECNFKIYRKNIFEAHNIIDRL